MKKLIAVFLLLAFILCSCEGTAVQKNERIFDYQDDLKSVEGVISEGAETYGIKLYFSPEGEGNRSRRIEYTSPESVKGLVFTVEGGKITAELSGIRIANSFFAAEDVFRFGELFCLSEEDIYSIEKGEDDTTVAMGKGKDIAWQVTTDDDGIPKEITYESKEGSYRLKIRKTEFFDKSDVQSVDSK